MNRVLLSLALCALAVSGCSTHAEVRGIARPSERVKSVVILPFADARVPEDVLDRAVYGRTTVPEIGAHVSEVLGDALINEGAYDVIHDRKLFIECRQREIHVDKLSELPPREIATLLGADAVITGEVLSMDQSWVFYSSAADIRFRAFCTEAETGKLMWIAESGGISMFEMEYDPVSIATAEIARRVARNELDWTPLPLPPSEKRFVKRHELLGDVYIPAEPTLNREDLPFRRSRRAGSAGHFAKPQRVPLRAPRAARAAPPAPAAPPVPAPELPGHAPPPTDHGIKYIEPDDIDR